MPHTIKTSSGQNTKTVSFYSKQEVDALLTSNLRYTQRALSIPSTSSGGAGGGAGGGDWDLINGKPDTEDEWATETGFDARYLNEDQNLSDLTNVTTAQANLSLKDRTAELAFLDLELGSSPATEGILSLDNNSFIFWRNAGGDGNIRGIGVDGSDVIHLGDADESTTIDIHHTIHTPDFSDWFSVTPAGWEITTSGIGDFRTLYIDELVAKAFTADVAQALAGSDFLTKSVAKLAEDFTIPAVEGTVDIIVEDHEGLPDLQVFESGDWIRLRVIDRTGGGLTIGDVYGTVADYVDGTGANGIEDGHQQWTLTVDYAGASDVLVGDTIYKGAIVLDYGVSGDTFIERSVLDRSSGTDFDSTPFDRIVQWTNAGSGGPRPSAAGYSANVLTQTGNINGLAGLSSPTYGFFAKDNVYIDLGDDDVFALGKDVGGVGNHGINLDANNYWYGTGDFEVGDGTHYLKFASGGDVDINVDTFLLDAVTSGDGLQINSSTSSFKLLRDSNDAVTIQHDASIPALTTDDANASGSSIDVTFTGAATKVSQEYTFDTDESSDALEATFTLGHTGTPTAGNYEVVVTLQFWDGSWNNIDEYVTNVGFANTGIETFLTANTTGYTKCRLSIEVVAYTFGYDSDAEVSDINFHEYTGEVVINNQGVFIASTPNVITRLGSGFNDVVLSGTEGTSWSNISSKPFDSVDTASGQLVISSGELQLPQDLGTGSSPEFASLDIGGTEVIDSDRNLTTIANISMVGELIIDSSSASDEAIQITGNGALETQIYFNQTGASREWSVGAGRTGQSSDGFSIRNITAGTFPFLINNDDSVDLSGDLSAVSSTITAGGTQLISDLSSGIPQIRLDRDTILLRIAGGSSASQTAGAYITLEGEDFGGVDAGGDLNLFAGNNGTIVAHSDLSAVGGTFTDVLNVSSANDLPIRVESTDAAVGILFTDPDASGSINYLGSLDRFSVSSLLRAVNGLVVNEAGFSGSETLRVAGDSLLEGDVEAVSSGNTAITINKIGGAGFPALFYQNDGVQTFAIVDDQGNSRLEIRDSTSDLVHINDGGSFDLLTDLQADNFSAGSTGWQIAYDGDAQLKDLTVRGGLFASEFVVEQTRVMTDFRMSVGGGRVESVSGSAGTETVTLSDDFSNANPFTDGDIVLIQQRTGANSGTIIKKIYRRVASISSLDVTFSTTGITWTAGTANDDTGSIAAGDDISIVGHVSNANRDHFIHFDIAGVAIPAIRFFDGVDDVDPPVSDEIMRVGGLDPGGTNEFSSALTGSIGMAGKIGGDLAFAITDSEGLIGGFEFTDTILSRTDTGIITGMGIPSWDSAVRGFFVGEDVDNRINMLNVPNQNEYIFEVWVGGVARVEFGSRDNFISDASGDMVIDFDGGGIAFSNGSGVGGSAGQSITWDGVNTRISGVGNILYIGATDRIQFVNGADLNLGAGDLVNVNNIDVSDTLTADIRVNAQRLRQQGNYSWSGNVANNAVSTLVFNSLAQGTFFMVSARDNSTNTVAGCIFYRTATGHVISTNLAATNPWAVQETGDSSPPTNLEGTNGKITIFRVNDGRMYINNRWGNTANMKVSILDGWDAFPT